MRVSTLPLLSSVGVQRRILALFRRLHCNPARKGATKAYGGVGVNMLGCSVFVLFRRILNGCFCVDFFSFRGALRGAGTIVGVDVLVISALFLIGELFSYGLLIRGARF